MKNNIVLPTKEDLRKLILKTIPKKSWKRKELIMEVIKKCGFSDNQLKDTGSDSLSTRLKSLTGVVINELLSEKAIVMTDEYKLEIAEKKIPDKKELVEIFLKKYLTDEEFKDSSPGGKKNTIKAVMGDIIKRKKEEMVKAVDVVNFLDNELRKNEVVYNNIIKEKEKYYPKTPLGNKLKLLDKKFMDCRNGKIKKEVYKKDVYKAVMDCISFAGGEFFERFCMSLIKACYGRKVIKDELTAGPGDKGIDGVIIIKDDFGFSEKIFIQAKTKRKRGFIPQCEIREFLGVMTAYKASKGLLISNSSYHKETFKFADRVDNFILIDQKKLFELMQQHSIGVTKVDDIWKIDENMFLN